MAGRSSDFQTIRSEGGLLPPDLLRRVLDPQEKLDGMAPADYGLPPGERLNEAITQSWNRLRKHRAEFRNALKNLSVGEAGTGLTNDKWSVPLLRELSFGLLPASAAPEIGGKTYAINRFFGATAIHLVGCGVDLDRRTPGVKGAALANPHGLVQDFLNRSPTHQWAILSNGLQLRILRDSQAISRQSYLEFDLEAMFDGEVFSDFVLLWLMAHATRFAAREGDPPESCWLERWTRLAEEQGTRALGDLRAGVEKALQALGQGFVGQPKNTTLRDALRTGQLTPQDLHGQLLRIVYRLIFLFVAEDRTLEGVPLLHAPDNAEAARIARERYEAHYSAGRLRDLAGDIRGSRHGDLWWQLNIVVGALSGDKRFEAVRDQLALPVLGSFLWSPDSTAALNAPSLAVSGGTELANADLLDAIRNLAFTRQNRSLRPVDYKNLGAEELGGVYESLLALTPQVSGDGAKFTFAEFAGNERKTSGSYYTPDSLVQCLLESVLDPMVDEAIKGKSGAEAEKAILALKVCDPAVGSGHFLVGAAHRLARHLARIRAAAQGEGEPSPTFYQHSLRDVIGRCLYGVDINPMAAELCRVSLWLEALEPGKPLSFLDHHIRVGNSLLGTTPPLIAGGLPDDAFTAIEGDERPVCAQLKRRNKAEREGFDQRDLLGEAEQGVAADLAAIATEARTLDSTPDDTIDAVQRKASQFRRLVVSPEYKHAQQVADAWCAAFLWPKTVATLASVVTSGAIQRLGIDPNALSPAQIAEVGRFSTQYQFFHWHLAFPEVFAKGGFDCVLGNPPWDQMQFREQEFFATRAPDIARAPTEARRKQMISSLLATDPELFKDYQGEQRRNEGDRHFALSSGRYPYGARGRVNTYLLFIELSSQVAARFIGMIVPSGVVTDESGRLLFANLLEQGRIRRLWDFENRALLFPDVDSRARFALYTIGPSSLVSPDFCFGLHQASDATEPSRHFQLTASDFRAINPNTLTCPSFSGQQVATLVLAIHRRLEVVKLESTDRLTADGWGIATKPGLLNMAADSALFQSDGSSDKDLPVYEGKMFTFYDHRFADVVISATALLRQGQSEELSSDDHLDPHRTAHPRYWVPATEIRARVAGQWDRGWIPGWKEITSPTNARTLVPAVLPLAGIGHKIPVFLPQESCRNATYALVANFASYVCDFVCRSKLNGTSLTPFTFKQLPVLAPDEYSSLARWSTTNSLGQWILPRVLELTYTAWDLEPFAGDCGFAGAPFRWDEARRFLIQAELDAAFFHLYLSSDADGDWQRSESESEENMKGLKASFLKPREAVSYIMDTFPIVQKKDIQTHGDYRTKLQILEIYDRMAEAMKTGVPYKTVLNPPPADLRCCHPAKHETQN